MSRECKESYYRISKRGHVTPILNGMFNLRERTSLCKDKHALFPSLCCIVRVRHA